jgi:hypothetical protein
VHGLEVMAKPPPAKSHFEQLQPRSCDNPVFGTSLVREGDYSAMWLASLVGERIGDLALIKANSGWLIDTGVASTYFLRLFGAQGLHRVDFGGAPCG